jgi:tetratricopeptide (TPR) repeat protein
MRAVARLGVQAAEALDYAHQLGVVHRDIKPGNLMVDARGQLWVTDFGLAQFHRDGEASLTLTGDLVGTLRYMSPEQALAKRSVIDHRTDTYSLGATLYELLTLQPVFRGTDRQELLRQIAFDEPTAPRRLNRTIPAELETVVLKALEKAPQDRYATAQELADDLCRFLQDRPVRARRPTSFQRLRKWARRHRPMVTVVAICLLMALAAGLGSVGWVLGDRAVRHAEAERVVAAALDESASWQEQRRLPEALSAARRAKGLLAGADVGEALRQQVAARLADLELLDRLEKIRLAMSRREDGHFDLMRLDDLYGQAFREASLDVEVLPAEEAAERIRKSTVAVELAAILDHWALMRHWARRGTDPGKKHLFQVARLVDSDSWRTQLREAMEKTDRQALRKLATSEGVFDLPVVTLNLLGIFLMNDREAGALKEMFLREAQRRHPDDFWLNGLLVDLFSAMQTSRPEEAVRFATVLVALRPGSSEARVILVQKLRAAGRLDEAIAECRKAIVINRKDARALMELGITLSDKGCLDEAIAAYQKAIILDPKSTLTHYNLGNALAAKNRQDEAIPEYEKAITLNRKFAFPHNGLANALFAKGQLDDAIAEFRKAIALDPKFADPHSGIGLALYEKGCLEEAIAEYGKAIALNPTPAAHNGLGNALAKKGSLDDAIGEFRKAIALVPKEGKAQSNLGAALFQKGRLDDAIAEFERALALDPKNVQTRMNLGAALRARGRLVEAIGHYKEAVRLRKDVAEIHYALGQALADNGQFNEAIVEYREAIRLKNDYAEPYCNLGHALIQLGRFAEALPYRRRGHELGSKNPGWAYPSAQWVQNCELLVKLDAKLPDILSGKEQPTDTAERLILAWFCQTPTKKRYADAVRLYVEAFAGQPASVRDQPSTDRYNAARAAALAGCGQGKDADKLSTKELTDLRLQALDWLRAELKTCQQLLVQSTERAGPFVAGRMQYWLGDKGFSGVRGPDALSALPEAERGAWQELWKEVEALRQRATHAVSGAGSQTPSILQQFEKGGR